MTRDLDLSIVMPCLDEERTVAVCVREALVFLHRTGLSGEVIVVDNGSADQSAARAEDAGARVITEPRRGYGRALRTGLVESRGAVVVMGDCDTTYDFLGMGPLVDLLRSGEADIVIGDRFCGLMERGAMPLSHRLGVPALSLCGRLKWHVDVRDFHCGLRGITRDALAQCTYTTSGMEFATEMIAEAARRDLRIAQVPVALRRCAVSGRKPKLRTIADGWRHLRYILTAQA